MASRAIIISASILAADFRKLEEEVKSAVNGGADWIHIDVMDGVFVPNISMGPMIVEVCHSITSLPIDVHLMIVQPERYIETFIKAGAKNVSIHIESNPNINRIIESIHSAGCQAGVVLNPCTPAASIDEVLADVEQVLVMSVNPGYGGQKFIPSVLEKIKSISTKIRNKNLQTIIQIDGGISAETLPLAYEAGARNFVAGVSIFKHPDGIEAGIHALRESIQ